MLGGVDRLPELDNAFAELDVLTDRMIVQLIEGFGSRLYDPGVMCLYEHHRGDRRRSKRSPGGARSSLLTIADVALRRLTPLSREGNLPDQFWLHNSGNLLTGRYAWGNGEGGRKRQVRPRGAHGADAESS